VSESDGKFKEILPEVAQSATSAPNEIILKKIAEFRAANCDRNLIFLPFLAEFSFSGLNKNLLMLLKQ